MVSYASGTLSAGKCGRAEDKAEALEPVQTGISWNPNRGGADEDDDMIPLIDVSLVLLVFFMMLRLLSDTGQASPVNTPSVYYKHIMSDDRAIWIGIMDDKSGPSYQIGQGPNGGPDRREGLSRNQMLARLDEMIAGNLADVRIAADQTLPYEVVKGVTVEVAKRRPTHVRKIYAEVHEKEQP